MVAVLAVPGCGEPAAFIPPPTEVAVVEVSAGRIEQVHEFAGNVEASRNVQVRAQVGGVIQARPFNEGQAVRAGEVLFRLDRTAYEAESRAANSRQTLARYEALLKDNAVSRQDYDNAASLAQQTQVQALGRALTLAQRRYESGVSSYLEVLDAQRGLYTARLALAQTERLYLSSTVRLYKAVGGGWGREVRP